MECGEGAAATAPCPCGLTIGHDQLWPGCRRAVLAGVVAQVVTGTVVVIVQGEVQPELSPTGPVDRHQTTGIECPFRPRTIAGGIAQDRHAGGAGRRLKIGRFKALLPLKPPVLMSASREPCVVNGLVPLSVPRCNRRVADRIVALAGRVEVSNDKIDLY